MEIEIDRIKRSASRFSHHMTFLECECNADEIMERSVDGWGSRYDNTVFYSCGECKITLILEYIYPNWITINTKGQA